MATYDMLELGLYGAAAGLIGLAVSIPGAIKRRNVRLKAEANAADILGKEVIGNIEEDALLAARIELGLPSGFRAYNKDLLRNYFDRHPDEKDRYVNRFNALKSAFKLHLSGESKKAIDIKDYTME